MKKTLLLILFLMVFTITVYMLVLNTPKVEKNPEKILKEMSIEEKVGQLFMFGFWGKEPDYYITKMIKERYIGGIHLLGYNFDGEGQIKKLTSDLQGMSKLPLFIAVDQEGGDVARIWFEDTYNISQYDIENEQEAFDIAQRRGKKLAEFGINLNFSPVLDHITDEKSFLYKRSFKGSQEDSANLAISMIKGYQKAGILSCIKHFPGHMNDTLDSHSELDSIEISVDEFDEYIYQFKEALKYSDAVMTSHILFPLIDTDNPVSLSKYFITELLREELHFNGLVITDDMQMKAIYDRYSVKEAAVKAVLAGNDILLYTSNPEEQVEAYNAVLQAVNEGIIKEEDLDKSVLRILKMKYSLEE